MKAEIAEVFAPLIDGTEARFFVSDGGRGGGRSWAFARALLIRARRQNYRVLCCREFQTSIRDSVHRLLADQLDALGWQNFFNVTRESIVGRNGSIFIFKGLYHNAPEIKSMEGIDFCWVEEAQSVSEESWSYLIPTIRKPQSQIWVTFNPYRESDPTYQRFIVNPTPGSVRMRAGWRENPWFPEVLKSELEHDRVTNPDRYQWIWEGKPLGISDAQVFRGKYEVIPFDTPAKVQLFFGADWGFAKDPTTLIRCFVQERCLYIDHEAYGVGVEIDETPQLFDSVPESRRWKIYADSARPETISHMRRNGFPLMQSVPKWPGSVEDGIEFLRNYSKIYIHPRCKHTIQEFELYRYKQDRISGDILPIIVDDNNHIMDALRYSQADYIRARGVTTPKTNIRGSLGI
jgi:phage terminase large subunit